MKNKFLFACACLTVLISGCNNDDSQVTTPIQKEEPKQDDPPAVKVLIGVFKDAEVQGLSFETPTQSGITNEKGEFSYLENESVTFKVGNIVLGVIKGQDVVTPISLAQQSDSAADITSVEVMNMAALLQTLDADQTHENGIQISETVAGTIGVSEIDFSAPIENTLSNVVLNVAKNSGTYLNVVYPVTAAKKMATSLGIEINIKENLVVSQFIPFLKAFLSSKINSNIPFSAVHDHKFDTNGKLISTDIVLRYSGRIVYTIDYENHTEKGLPTKGFYSYKYETLPLSNGLNPPSNQTLVNFSFTYDGQNHIEKMERYYNGGNYSTPILFNEFDDEHRPLNWVVEIEAQEGNYSDKATYNVTYSNGKIASENLVQSIKSNNDGNQFEYNYNSDYIYGFDSFGNFNVKEDSNVIKEIQIINGEQTTYNSILDNKEQFIYTSGHVLEKRTITGNSTYDDYQNLYSKILEYDDEELLASSIYTSGDYVEKVTYNKGVRESLMSYNNEVLELERVFNADGSWTDITFNFDENGTLFLTIITEYNSNYLRIKQVIKDANGQIIEVDFYNDAGYIIKAEYYTDGNLTNFLEYEYDANNYIIKGLFKDSLGNLLTEDIYHYNNNYFLKSIERFNAAGELISTFEYEYDDQGFLVKYTGRYANGKLAYVFFYENGTIVRCEYYDEQGNLDEVVDHSSSGKKSILDIERIKQSQQLHQIEGKRIDRSHKKRNEVFSRRNQEMILQNQRLVSDFDRLNNK